MDVDAELENAHGGPKPYDKLWIPDGNVVLATDSLLFKVHKSVLSMQSSVFRDMFDLLTVDGTQNTSNVAGTVQDMYEGIPLVRLAGDKGEDVAHLLHALYERQYYRIDNDDTPRGVIIALLLLSTKYDFKHIRRDVIAHISRHYPRTLAALDSDRAGQWRDLSGGYKFFSDFALLEVLHTANVDVLLPSVYHECAKLSHQSLFRFSNNLSEERFRTLVLGKFRLEHAINELVAMVPGQFLEESGALTCEQEGRPIHAPNLVVCVNRSNLSVAEGNHVVKRVFDGFCATCKIKMAKLINDKRQEIWANIPGFFGFPGWDVLQVKLDGILSGQTED